MSNTVDIAVTDLGKVYCHGRRRVEALRGVSLSVVRGETLCIVGPSGCGKSTLLRILLGLELHTSGTLSVNQDRWDDGVAYIPQSPALLPWRTVLQNAALGIEVRGQLDHDSLRRLHRALRTYDLEGFEHSVIGDLSGGMRQRVELIRALESRPSLLFCDEPFAAIDFVGRLALNTRFKCLCKETGVTTVFVTHNIEEAIFLGDSVTVLTGRPGRQVSTYRPQLSLYAEDAVRCRESPEFAGLFERIWDDLKAPGSV